MVEESEERLSEDQVQQILEILVEHFPDIAKPEVKTEPEDSSWWKTVLFLLFLLLILYTINSNNL